MKNWILTLAASIALVANAQGQGLQWTDTNSASASVMRYVVYDVTGSAVYRTLDLPKINDEPKVVQTQIDRDAAGKWFNVTAVNGMGLQSLPSESVRVPDIALPPIQLSLAFDLANRRTKVFWEDPNPPEAEVEGFRLFGRVGTNAWVQIEATTNITRQISFVTPTEPATFRMTTLNFWGDSEFSEEISTPTVVVPVTSLRLIGVGK